MKDKLLNYLLPVLIISLLSVNRQINLFGNYIV